MNSDTPQTGILYRDELRGYDFGVGHPFRGDRYKIFYNLLSETLPQDNLYRIIQAEPASDQDLLLICEEDYIAFTREFFDTGNLRDGIMEQFSRYQSVDNLPNSRPTRLEKTARLVIGQAKTACDFIMQDKFLRMISIGGGLHHAKRTHGEGFCLYNDVAFCGFYLAQKYGLNRILILDTDAHAGNGTAEYFYSNPNVLFIDIHQDPRTIYPATGFINQTGEGEGKGFTVNIPLPPGAGDNSYRLAFDSIIMPVAAEFKPQIIIQNGGSDPHYYDELTSLNLSLDGFRMIGEKVEEMASVCNNRLISLIASGYDRQILPFAWLSLIGGLTGANISFEKQKPESRESFSDSAYEETKQVIKEVKNTLREYWECLK